jgi:hypothetical protein
VLGVRGPCSRLGAGIPLLAVKAYVRRRHAGRQSPCASGSRCTGQCPHRDRGRQALGVRPPVAAPPHRSAVWPDLFAPSLTTSAVSAARWWVRWWSYPASTSSLRHRWHGCRPRARSRGWRTPRSRSAAARPAPSPRRHPRHDGMASRRGPGYLYAVQERVCRGRAGLDPVGEAVATATSVVGPHVDRLGRAAFDDVYVDAPTRQRAALEHGGDRRPDLSLRGAHLPLADQTPGRGFTAPRPASAYGSAWMLWITPTI